jgi:peroxiredoxin Q/BCP
MGPGEVVPDFELPDQNGIRHTLSELLGPGPVVLFFYPAAMTPGCTRESCHFRDLANEFRAVGAQPVGISADKVDKQKRFADKYDFKFLLLSDPDATVANLFGVHRRLGLAPTKRTTFVIDQDRRVLDVIKSEFNTSKHADRALELLRARAGS